MATDQIVIGGGAVTGILTIGTGGTVNISEFVNMGNISSELGVLNMNGGTLNCGVMIPSTGHLNVGYNGNSTLNMTSGVINLTSYLSIADQATATGYVHFNGGTINATDLLMNFNAHLDISGGTLILDGNDLPTITGFIGSGKITAYNGAGTILKDYNITNSGKTTVRGYFANPKATNPAPGNGRSYSNIRATLLSLFHQYGVTAVFDGHYYVPAYVNDAGLEIITTESETCPLGNLSVDTAGFQIVKVYPNHIEHKYWCLGCFPTLQGDFNNDGTVNFTDLGMFAGTWLYNGIWP